ncbi:Co2 transporter containing CBS domains [invertebrate metagenome]|uniref:Co2 transporter containing CBS domains n=1 Tax=invertebrate metagenome TaxID=1711999 RepID=A0A484H6W1_9ZZZZ
MLSVIIILLLLVLSAFFSGAETALTAHSQPLMHQLARQGNTRAARVNRLFAAREHLIGAILIGNNLVNVLSSALATSVLIALFGEAGIAYATLLMTMILVIFSEILPKTFALRHAHGTALTIASLAHVMVTILKPAVILVHWMVAGMLKLFCADRTLEGDSALRLAELRGAIDLHSGHEIRHERNMLRSVLDLAEVTVGEIMTHRRQMVSINVDQTPAAVVEQVLTSPYTRIPLWQSRLDNIIGVLHVKALLRMVQVYQGNLDRLDIVTAAGPPWFIPASTALHEQLQAFRERHEHFALVVDEYGSILGVVTLEDILEEIVGDIADEHDVAVAGVRLQPDGSYLIGGNVTLRDLNRQFEWNLPDEEAATIAGLVLQEARCIPEPSQVFTFHGFRFEIMRRQRNQITTVRVTPVADALE